MSCVLKQLVIAKLLKLLKGYASGGQPNSGGFIEWFNDGRLGERSAIASAFVRLILDRLLVLLEKLLSLGGQDFCLLDTFAERFLGLLNLSDLFVG